MTRLVNIRRVKKYDVYIGRGGDSIWGNPFSHEKDSLATWIVASREEAIARYEEWIIQQPHLMSRLPMLKGKTLGCWCHPLPCHGNVLLKLIAQYC